jgi:acetolactate synthase-1/2/3 large subunit
LVRHLELVGVTHAFGCTGGTIAVFCEALAQSNIDVVQCRHESGAAFAAAEAHFASGAPAVVFTTSGPSIMNALNGLMAARSEGAKVLLVSGSTPPRQRGRAAFQETSATSMPRSIFTKGSIFDFAIDLADAGDVPMVLRTLQEGFARRGAFVAHVALPSSVQATPLEPAATLPQSTAAAGLRPEDVTELAALLTREPFGVWVGFGARHHASAVRALAEKACAPVVASPRGRGIFPETHPLFLGVTGLASPWDTTSRLVGAGLKRLLVLGSRLGEFSSLWDESIIPAGGLIQVDVDPDVPRAFPGRPRHLVRADVGDFLAALTPHVRGRPSDVQPPPPVPAIPSLRGGPVRPSVLLAYVQRIMVDAGAPIIVDCGNSFAWANSILRFTRPNYRVSLGWGSMGQAVAGVIGSAMATSKRSVAIVGDGAMLMQNELSTAVKYGVDAVWVILNDAQYGMIEQGMRAGNLEPVETQIPRVDFVAMAESVGAKGVRIGEEHALEAGLRAAMEARGPFVVDVTIDRDELAPIGKRVTALERQGVGRTSDE